MMGDGHPGEGREDATNGMPVLTHCDHCDHCGAELGADRISADDAWYCSRSCAVAALAMRGAACALGRHIVNVVVVEPIPGELPTSSVTPIALTASIILACPACDSAWEVQDSTFWKTRAVKLEIDTEILAALRRGGR